MGAAVYALRDATGNLFYVGKSSNTEARFAAHRSRLGQQIKIEVLQSDFTNEESMDQAERRWIRHFKDQGFALKNVLSPEPIGAIVATSEQQLIANISAILPILPDLQLKAVSRGLTIPTLIMLAMAALAQKESLEPVPEAKPFHDATTGTLSHEETHQLYSRLSSWVNKNKSNKGGRPKKKKNGGK